MICFAAIPRFARASNGATQLRRSPFGSWVRTAIIPERKMT
jgi:hypothetical protein